MGNSIHTEKLVLLILLLQMKSRKNQWTGILIVEAQVINLWETNGPKFIQIYKWGM